jgi:hypothetical protein
MGFVRSGVVGTVCYQAPAWVGLGDEFGRAADVGVVTGRGLQRDRAAEQIGDQVEFRAAAATVYANSLILRGFFWAPAAERCAFT